MKRIALTAAIALLAAPEAHASWTLQQGNGDQNTTYLSIGAAGPDVAAAMGYVNSGSSTQVLYSHTLDGDTWIEGGFTLYGSAVEFASDTVGFMGGLLGKVWQTTDGGSSWVELPYALIGGGTMADSESVVDVEISDDGLDVWIAGAAGSCAHSEDGGASWVKVSAPLPAGEGLAVRAAAVRGDTVWLVGGLPAAAPTEGSDFEEPTFGNPASDGFVLRSDDAGETFAIVAEGLEYALNDVSFVNPAEGWAAAATYTEGGAAIGKTADGGETWSFTTPPDLPDDEVVGLAMGASKVPGACVGARFFGRLVGLASCTTSTYEFDGSNALYLTADGGETWTIQPGYKAAFPNQMMAASAILDTAMPDCHRIWLTGEGKTIARWDNDDPSMDCAAGGSPNDDVPDDIAGAAADDSGCGCAAAGSGGGALAGLLAALL